MGFSEWYTQCTDVNEAEAMFRFVDGLSANVQAWVRTQNLLICSQPCKWLNKLDRRLPMFIKMTNVMVKDP